MGSDPDHQPRQRMKLRVKIGNYTTTTRGEYDTEVWATIPSGIRGLGQCQRLETYAACVARMLGPGSRRYLAHPMPVIQTSRCCIVEPDRKVEHLGYHV